MFLSLLIALAGAAAAHRAPDRRGPSGSGAPRPASSAFVLLILALLRGRRAAAHARPAPLGRPRVGHVAGHQLHAGDHRALPRGRRLGAHGDPARRDGAPGPRRRCWPSGRGAARRRATRSPRRSALGVLYAVPVIEHGPDSPVSSTARCSASCSPASSGSSASRSDQMAVADGLRGGHGDRRGGHRAAPRQHASRGSTTRTSPRSSSPPRPRRSRGSTATGR